MGETIIILLIAYILATVSNIIIDRGNDDE